MSKSSAAKSMKLKKSDATRTVRFEAGHQNIWLLCNAALVELSYPSIFELHIHCKPFMKLKRQNTFARGIRAFID